ncbi:MAG: hypothetical protein IKT89_05740 [Clostridia bacterium]|nr:hypothetical protein [Clostridia bacterium]
MNKIVEWVTEKDVVVDKNGKMISPAVGHFEIKNEVLAPVPTLVKKVEQLENRL